MSGLFVTLDGPSGVGKSTVGALLRSALVARDVPTVLTTEPSGSPLASWSGTERMSTRGSS